KYNLYIPKFSIKTSYTLNAVLSDMGMTDMFGGADFGGISEARGLSVSKVVHKATLDVDETGATAAAATGVGIERLVPVPVLVPVLKFNRPFLVLIADSNTEEILFMGKILNPLV
ncbi:serpin A3-5-like, partial [Etheostoma cragini]|uniref:serpin A3-5-like n=1 Tax=Etheostoma cragini TaxID=417921 RepID=UPI00155E967E